MYCIVCEKKQHKMLEFPLLEHPILETITNASCYFIYLHFSYLSLRIKHDSVYAHHWGLPLESKISLTISSVAPLNIKMALGSPTLLDLLIFTTNLGG